MAAGLAGAGDHRPGPARPRRARAARRGARGRRAAAAGWTPTCRCSSFGPRAASSTASAASSAAATTISSSPSATRSSAAGWRRCCAALGRGRVWAACGSARWRSTRWPRGLGGRASAVELSKKEFALAAGAGRRSDAGVHARGAAARACGAFSRWARRARWTRTPRGCAGSSACGGQAFVVNVWGIGYRLVDGEIPT